ncbi:MULTISPECIES: P-type conjugative transfer protein TrbJ [Pseudomonas]|uniref:P-type conjugative transfer protein TrbJ n=1 Tax=Pseudomonas TaxID=286 RepID=UPI001BAF8EC5|nr:P-type conjugative transfer protein TrbJ [Pseudomonas putida]EKT4568146.1 P-type conjugative transfer protein TrbJ [Pseudomonas putida]QUG87555.1 P-type conjugative transfer protein TrbJ [Pseudomonas putida]
MKKPKKQQWIFAVASALPFHLAFAGIPVVDGVNLSQTTVSAIQNVAAVTKQIEQYKTQLQQYQIMLRNSAAPADYIWSQADETISMLLAAQDTLSYYKTQAGSLQKYLERYQDTAHYESAPCIGSDACGVSDQQAIAQAQKEASSTKKRANDALLTSVSKQQETLRKDAGELAGLQRQATSAEGQMQAIQAANQLASAQANQLLQIRSLLIAQQNAQATSAQVRVDRDAQHTAADKRALSSRNSPSADKGW